MDATDGASQRVASEFESPTSVSRTRLSPFSAFSRSYADGFLSIEVNVSGKNDKAKRRRLRQANADVIYLRARERRRAKRMRVVTGVLLLAMVLLCVVVAFLACAPGELSP
jgi:hypothetical protein